jgi:hypothetical protein
MTRDKEGGGPRCPTCFIVNLQRRKHVAFCHMTVIMFLATAHPTNKQGGGEEGLYLKDIL